MKSRMHIIGLFVLLLGSDLKAGDANLSFHSFAPKPPMGWNSWLSYGCTVTEADTKANADYMARHLKKYGWEYVIVDIQWYEPQSKGYDYAPNPQIAMDAYGRMLPVTTKFPSAADGKGFKLLAGYIHSLGLKFGVHIMRGIPKAAVEKNLPVLGTTYRAAEIADRASTCPWNPDMYGLDMSKPGAQEYLDSVYKLLADWGVDFVKVDDLSRPYHQAEIEGIRKAIDKTGRAIVFSTSPGATPVDKGAHIAAHANMWRIRDDFWDEWKQLEEMFSLLEAWTPFRGAGHWPDADLLALGRLVRQNRMVKFTTDEQITMMTLWCIARSPLMIGANLPDLDEFTESLLTNVEALAVNQNSANNRQLFRRDGRVAWVADVPGTQDRYLAVFNLGATEAASQDPSAALYDSGLVTRNTPGHMVDVSADITGASTLCLVVDDGGDNYVCDHADWIEPKLIGPAGELKLTGLKWASATSGWGAVTVGRSVGGGELTVAGKKYKDGIGTHSTSVIVFNLPKGYTRFVAKAGLDESGVSQKLGGATVRFRVLKESPPVPTVVSLPELGFDGTCEVRDLWAQKNLGTFAGVFGARIPAHGAGLYRLSPVKAGRVPAASRQQVASPDGGITVDVQAGKGLTYSVNFEGAPLVLPSRLGLVFGDGLKLGENVEVVKAETRSNNTTWKDDFGKSSAVADNYRELRLRLREARPAPAAPVEFELVVRAYNDGVGLRYVLPPQAALGKFTLTEDATQFLFAGDYRAWVGANTGYETRFPELRLSQMSGDRRSLPLVVETPKAYVVVAEADVRDWAGASLVAARVPGLCGVKAALISPVDSETPRQSPWHAVIIVRQAGELTVSTLLRNLAAPSQIADPSWIQPGITAWDVWWTGVNPYWDKYKGLEARGNTRSHKDYIDLAAEMGWPYMLVDWFWYDQESRDPETAIKPLEHIDMPELMAYAKSKGVKLLLWVNSKNIRSIGAEKLFATYAGWGAAGVKIDFFPHNGSQATQRWLEQLLQWAAQHKLVVDFHGAYTPTGLSRTWPNLLTQEGVLGEEYVKLGREFSPSHMITLPFTRGLLGPADVTPGGFVNVREDQFVANAIPAHVTGTRARQLALSVLMDSPLLCLSDSPQNYRGQPGFEFYRALPTTWDETRVISAEMAEHLVQARRKGDRWWIAGMNNRNPLTLQVKLDFLGEGKFTLRVFGDTPESATRLAAIGESLRTVTRKDILEIHMQNAGGFAADIKPTGILEGDK